MKLLYIAILILFLACCVYGIRFLLLIRRSAELVSVSSPFEKTGDLLALPFLFVGDSTGVGIGSSSPQKTVAGYFSQDFPHRSIRNISKSGRKTQDLIPVLESQPTQSADWIFIQIGGNDILYFTSQEKLQSHIARVLDESKRIGKHSVLLTSGNVGIAPFFPTFMGGIWTQKTKKVRSLFEAAAQERGIVYVDLFQSRRDDVFLTDIPRFYSADLLHPTGEGYAYWYGKIREAIAESSVGEELR